MTPQIKQRIEQIRRGEVPEGYIRNSSTIIPSGWKKSDFSALAIIASGLVDPKQEPYCHMKHIGPENIEKNTGRILETSLASELGLISGKFYFDSKSIVYSKIRPNLNKVCAPNFEGICSADCYSITPTQAIRKYYLLNLMLSYDFYKRAVAFSMRTGMPKINQDDLNIIPMCYPSNLVEQERIERILTDQDKLIALKEKLIEEKKLQKKALMQQLLTGKKRLPGFSDEWRKIKLSSVLIEGNKVAVVDTSMYRKMTVKLAFKGLEFTKIDREMADTRPFYVRKKNEIIIGKQNYFNGSVALVTDEFDGCICSNAIMSFSVKSANVKFILEYISQADFMKKREMLANGTGQKELSEKEFLNFEIKLPCIEEQNYIGNIASTCDSEILLLQKNLDEEKQKKKALMQLLLTGIVRVGI